MKVLLAHLFRARGALSHLAEFDKGWIEGDLIAGTERCNILNAEGNFLVQGATPEFIQSLRDKGLLKDEQPLRDNEDRFWEDGYDPLPQEQDNE